MSTAPDPAADTLEVLDALDRTLDAGLLVVTGIADDQWSAPTPCSEWTVGDLVDHLVGVHQGFAAVAAGETPPSEPEPRGADPADAYRRHASAVHAAFAAPGALERFVTVPFGTVPGAVAVELLITETLVHGWDLARSTRQPVAGLSTDLAERALAFSRDALAEIPADRAPFAPPRPVDDAAAAIDRLAALLGRDPAAQAAQADGNAAR